MRVNNAGGAVLFSFLARGCSAIRRRARAAVPVTLLVAALTLVLLGDLGLHQSTRATCGPVDGGPGVDTDKEDYQPNETVIITGCALEAYEGQNLTLSVTRPDGVVDATTVTVSSGGFTYNYLLNGITGTYTVKVMDGGTLLASETFTDHTSSTLQINNNDAAVHTLSVTLRVGWSGSGGDPTQARFANVTPTALGCPGPLDPSWSAWMAIVPDGPGFDTFPWTMAAGDTGHRKVCAQTGHGPLGSPTPGETLTADDTIWYTVANPALTDACGLDMVLVLDSSGSINATELSQMKSAFNSFVSAFLPETPTEMAVVDFDTEAFVIQPFTSNETDLNNAINSVASGGATNWDDALFDARSLLPHRPAKQDLIVFASDGNPNRRGGHVYPGHSPVVVAVTEQEAMDHATDESDEAKTDSIRILGLGIGSDLDVVNMKAVTGNTSHPPAPISPTVDVITTDFSTLASDLATLAAELCGGTITVHKTIDGDGDLGTTGDQSAGANWTFTTNVDPPDSSTPASGDTDGTGNILFDIDTGADEVANVDIIEPGETGYGFLSASCTKPDGPDGDTDPDPVGTPAFGAVNNITVNKFDIIGCTFYNVPLGMIEWEKRDESVPANPLQGGASFTVGGSSGPLACTGTPTNPLPVVDNGSNDANPAAGQLKLNNVCPGTYVVTETAAPTGYARDDDLTRSVTVAAPNVNQVIGTQGVDDPGNTDESDFHNRLGSSAWEKRNEIGSPPHPLQGGATFTVGGGSGPFACTGTLTNPITVVDNGTNDADPAPGQILVNNVCLGSYTVTETIAPSGYVVDDDPTRAVTVSEGDLNNVIGAQGTDEDGNTDESDFHNMGIGTITITKDAQPNDPQDFSFSGTCFAPFQLDDDGANSNPLSSSMTATHVAPSTCTVVEDGPPAGWALTALVCSDPDSGTTTSPGTRTATIDLDPGETVTCTFTNRTTAQFIVNKDFQPDNGGTVTITLVCTSGTVANDDPTASEADPANFTVTGFSPGTTCTATETPPGGYTANETNCQNVPITAGGTASCTILNQLAGQITIIKDAVPNDPQDFDFACTNLGTFSLDDDSDGTLSNTKTFPNVAPGSYTCTESNEIGWQISISCNDPDGGTTTSPPSANIDLDAGETVTCTFTNTFTPGVNPVGGIAGLLESTAAGTPSEQASGTSLTWFYIAAVLAALSAPTVGMFVVVFARRRTR
jgi:hypothetical protein